MTSTDSEKTITEEQWIVVDGKRVKVVSMNGADIAVDILALLVRNMLLILTLLALVYLRPEMSPPCARPRASKAVEFESEAKETIQTVRLN